jgi:hypothetical protein
METCFGCENLTTVWYADGSLYYGCSLIPGLIIGETSGFEGNRDPKRCEKFIKDLKYET